MQNFFFEAVQDKNAPGNHGKFMVGLFDKEWDIDSQVAPGHELLALCGWGSRHLLVIDMETGEGSIFHPGGLASADLNTKHKIWVCPLFEPFLGWLYDQLGVRPVNVWAEWLTHAPKFVELPDAEFALRGYRRTGERRGN